MKNSSSPIVVGTDGSEHAERAVAWAADEAAVRGLPLRIVHALANWGKDMPTYPARGIEEALPTVGQHLLDEAERQVRERQPGVEVTTRLLREAMPHVLRDQADEAFELVLGHRGLGGFRNLMLGSTALRVAGHANGPVVVVRRGDRPAGGEVVAGVDPFEDAPAMLEYAFGAAAARGTTLRAVHAFLIPDQLLPLGSPVSIEEVTAVADEALAEALAPWRQRFPQVKVVAEAVQGHPVSTLVTESENASLLVLGARGHTTLGGLLIGSISHGALHYAPCPTAIVRPRH